MHSLGAVLAVVTLAALPAVAHAQETRFGVSGGVNFVGGGASKVGVDINGVPVTGASRTGQFYSALLEQRSSMFVEWRYQQALHQTRGAAFMPFVLGMKF